MNDFSWQRFVVRWLLPYRAPGFVLLFIVLNLWFKPVFNIILFLCVAGAFAIAWLNEKDKYTVRLFYDEPFNPKKDNLSLIIAIIEGLILLVGLHFLYKGFTSVTGVTEQLFDAKISGGLFYVISAVSFITAFAVITGMMVLLYMISNTLYNRRLIIFYLLTDVLILMPFNFMFSYENNQQESLTQFYAGSMPRLYDQLLPGLQKKANDNKAKADIANAKSANLYLLIEEKRLALQNARDITEQKRRENRADTSAHHDIRSYVNDEATINSQLQKLEQQKLADSAKTNASALSLLANNKYNKLLSVEPVVKLLNNGKIDKDVLYDTVMYVKSIFIEIYDTDSSVRKDTGVIRSFERLTVKKEQNTDGFFNLMKQLTFWALKPELLSNEGKKESTRAQTEWNESLPKKRFFCFLFSILIDLFPLLIALSFLIYSKQKSHASR